MLTVISGCIRLHLVASLFSTFGVETWRRVCLVAGNMDIRLLLLTMSSISPLTTRTTYHHKDKNLEDTQPQAPGRVLVVVLGDSDGGSRDHNRNRRIRPREAEGQKVGAPPSCVVQLWST